MDNSKEKLENFKKAVSEIWLRDGENTWPIEINSIVHLFMDIFVNELTGDIRRLKDRGTERTEIARIFKTSARIIRLIMPCVLGMKNAGMPMDELRGHIAYLLSLVKELKAGDLFNRDGKNLVFSPGEFKHEVRESKMIPADMKSSLPVHKLCAVLWNYAESVCFKTHGLIREFHGPYQFPGETGEILVRDFYCLKAVELWEECEPVEYSHIRVVTAYENLDMTIDIYNNPSIREGGSYIGSLKSYYVEADGKLLDLDDVSRLCRVLSDVMIAITTKIENLDWRRLAEKYAEIFWFAKKELRDAVGGDWRIPESVKDRIKSGELNKRLPSLGQRDLQRMLRIAF